MGKDKLWSSTRVNIQPIIIHVIHKWFAENYKQFCNSNIVCWWHQHFDSRSECWWLSE